VGTAPGSVYASDPGVAVFTELCNAAA